MILQPCSWEEMKCKTKILHLMILLQGVHQVLSYRLWCLDLCSPKISLVLSAKEHVACRFIKSSVGELVVLLSKVCSQISEFQVVHHLSRKSSRGKKPMPKFDSLIRKIQKVLLSLGWVCYQFLLVLFFNLKYFNLGSGML